MVLWINYVLVMFFSTIEYAEVSLKIVLMKYNLLFQFSFEMDTNNVLYFISTPEKIVFFLNE